MILDDRVIVNELGIVDDDRYGNPIYANVAHTYFAQMISLSTSETIGVGVETVEARYRVVLPPSAESLAAARPPSNGADRPIKWKATRNSTPPKAGFTTWR